MLLGCQGRVIVTGLGKSGHIGRKIAATLASTGTPAFFVHAAEAVHGDLGMIVTGDVVLALSNSGETDELLMMLPLLKRHGIPLIAISSQANSRLARLANVHICVAVTQEACSLNLAPTASTTAVLAIGDALAVTLLEARGFAAEDFAQSHPAGSLGRRLLTYVADVMRHGDALPYVSADAPLLEGILMMTSKRLGMTLVIDQIDRIDSQPLDAQSVKQCGIFTDGDLRRLLATNADLRTLTMRDVMNAHPHTISAQALATEAAHQMSQRKINQLVVHNHIGELVGIVSLLDLLQAKVI
jgi:arabinose-5-phosphate isomerase